MNSLTEQNTPAAALTKYVPKGHSPKLYIEMTKHIMGVDQRGNARPFEDLLIFLMTSKRTGLDPLAKQIYPVYRWNSKQGKETMTIQAGIDGLRATAERSTLYAGSDDAVFVDEEPKNVEDRVRPRIATVTVYKINKITGERMPITASARWSEYAQKAKKKDGSEYFTGMWSTMPYNQLAKCAEALALRKAFPNDLGGVYAAEEMDQAQPLADLPAPTRKVIAPEATPADTAQEVSPETVIDISQARKELKEKDGRPVES